MLTIYAVNYVIELKPRFEGISVTLPPLTSSRSKLYTLVCNATRYIGQGKEILAKEHTDALLAFCPQWSVVTLARLHYRLSPACTLQQQGMSKAEESVSPRLGHYNAGALGFIEIPSRTEYKLTYIHLDHR